MATTSHQSHLHEQKLEVDVDSAFEDYGVGGSSLATSTQSLHSAVNEYIVENGRRYQIYFGKDKNPLPVDETEQDRLDMHHEMILLVMDGRLHDSPVRHPQRVLDVGTGTGIWAIDMADRYPSAEIKGIDLSPIQPCWVPPNCNFAVDDAELEWSFPTASFDLIHLRNVSQGVTDWPRVMSEVYCCTVPGGYVELGETSPPKHCDDGSASDDNPAKRFAGFLSQAMDKIGRPLPSGNDLVERLRSAGFVDIISKRYKLPVGIWPRDKSMKRVGSMGILNCETAFHAYGIRAMTKILGMGDQEADKLCKDAAQVIKDPKVHLYAEHWVVYGRKPR